MRFNVIAVDFDHTINNNTDISEGERYSKPFPGAKESLKALKERGHKIMIFSCNRSQWIEEWMTHWEIPYDYIWSGDKPVCDAYIDDLAVAFRGNWNEALKETLKLVE